MNINILFNIFVFMNLMVIFVNINLIFMSITIGIVDEYKAYVHEDKS